MDPLWNYFMVAGFRDGRRFLGCVDLQGTTWQASTLATGYGAYIAQPLLRKAVEKNEDTLTEQAAKDILENAMRVLFYRDARSLNRIQIATVDNNGIRITEPYALSTDWSIADYVKGYGA
jgi:20S proteasome subunit beta 7